MKITITHDQSSVDPSQTYTEEQFGEVLESLESEYAAAIEKEYPNAEIEFVNGSDTYSVRITETGMDDPSGIESEIQRLLETVFETGNFWI